jgi:hypothetical protein
MAECNRIKEILIPKRLCQKLDSTAFHRLYRHGNVAVSRDENDWQLPFGSVRELALQVKPALTRHPDIEYQTDGTFRHLRFEELGD